MTAFDNIKTNNWPSSTTDPFEDFCVLKLPLNDQASLTESLPVVVGSQDLFPKRTLTNTSTASVESGTVYSTEGTQTGSDYGAGHEITGAFRKGSLLYTASGEGAFAASNSSLRYTFPSQITVNTNVKIYFWRNGGNIKVNAGETDEQTDSTSSGYTTWTIPASDVGVLKNVELYTSGNTGPYWSGIEVDGVQLYDAPGGIKKHYDNSAVFNASVLTTTAPVPRGGAPRTLEFWAYLNSGASSWQNIISYGSSGAGQCFGINRGNSDSHNIAFTGYSSGDWDTGTSVASYLNTWTHFSVSYDSGTVEIFLNGTSIGTASRTLNTGGSTFVVGGSEHSGNNERFSGKIQDVRVYNKKIRTANFTPPGAILG